MSTTDVVNVYLDEVRRKYGSGIATEHAYRPALQGLIESLCEGINAINDAKRVEVGAPDFVLTEEKRDPLQLELIRSVPLGFVEAKDLKPGILDEAKNKEQLERYLDLGNVVHTDGLTFRFYFNRELVKEVVLGEVANGQIIIDSRGYDDLAYYFKQTVSRAGRTIRTAKLLALHMADRARPIRRTILKALIDDIEQDAQTLLRDQYAAFRQVLIHDLEPKDFADIYAETIAYGLFAARYNDDTPENFSLAEAAQRVPQTNPFLRQFFLQIAAYEKDSRLDWVLNNFADLFSYADVKVIMSTYGKNTGMNHDPVTHFYETFLGEYDSKRRKARGVYYTPLPVVQYIVRTVDRVLRDDFGLADGLADDSTVEFVEHFGDIRKVRAADGKLRQQTTNTTQIPRVQVLDPATGTSTFLNETIKLIAERKAKNLGSAWSSYIEENLLPRIHGFEILMAAYSMAHMRLGLTLSETGYKPSTKTPRLGVYLTNTLEPPAEYVGSQLDIFSSMGRVISEESHNADTIKRDLPIMAVLGNPPYSIGSVNKGKYIQRLIADYKRDLNERKVNLDDDYIKFIRYAENMVEKTGQGIVAMITNNSFLDGITHRQMRKHLLHTFDKIYILNLHGSAKKKETTPEGGRDDNVFDIMQGVSIFVGIKNGKRQNVLGSVYYADLYGKRGEKYHVLGSGENIKYEVLTTPEPYFFFAPKDFSLQKEYDEFISLSDLFIVQNSGIKTDRDKLFVDIDKKKLADRIERLIVGDVNAEFRLTYRVVDSSSYSLTRVLRDAIFDERFIALEEYRPFDMRYIYYDPTIISRPGRKVMQHQRAGNPMLLTTRQLSTFDYQHVLVADSLSDICTLSSQTKETGYAFPLYLYHEDGTHTANLNPVALKKLTVNLPVVPAPEEIFNYIYATLHSPQYRAKYKEFLKVDFPHVPLPEGEAGFKRLAALGNELKRLHLMQGVAAEGHPLQGEGSGMVETLRYVAGSVYINDTQYFVNVPEEAWNFWVGGYQPAQKWLKDRKGHTLGYKEVEHYQRIIHVLLETHNIMQSIDKR